MGRRPRDEKTKRAALELLMRGECRPVDVAKRAGVSPQLVDEWMRAAGIRWRSAYEGRVNGAWRRAMAGSAKPMRKRRARVVADKAKVEWDKRHAQEPKAVGD
jgi:hypothetical protein